VIAYRYRGSSHRVVLSGQDPACVIGSAPYSVTKILAAVVGGVLGMGLVGALLAAIFM
jgi:hypothetical protein